MENIILNFLKQQSISYRLFEHQPLFTINDVPIVTKIDGISVLNEVISKPHCKTLFLKDNLNSFFLVTVIENKRVDLKALSKSIGSGRLTFGNEIELFNILCLRPGSVSPFGLIFDKEDKVKFILDSDVLQYESVSFHPLRNDMNVVLSFKDFMKCMEELNHFPLTIPIISK